MPYYYDRKANMVIAVSPDDGTIDILEELKINPTTQPLSPENLEVAVKALKKKSRYLGKEWSDQKMQKKHLMIFLKKMI